MKKLLSGILWIVLVGLLAGSAMAAGFQINEQGARAMGQAMAFAARADDPSAIYFNPAGITQLEGTQFYFGGTAIIGNTVWTDVDGSEIDSRDRWEFPMHMYVTQQINDQWYFGLGVFVPYGLSKGWPDNFPGVYDSKEARLLSFCFNPNIAYKINERVSIAAGFDYYHTEGRLDRELYLQGLSDLIFGGYPLRDGYFSAIVKSDDFGWNAGIRVMLNDEWAVGASYRSQVNTHLEGDLELTVPHTGVPQIDGTLTALFPSQQAVHVHHPARHLLHRHRRQCDEAVRDRDRPPVVRLVGLLRAPLRLLPGDAGAAGHEIRQGLGGHLGPALGQRIPLQRDVGHPVRHVLRLQPDAGRHPGPDPARTTTASACRWAMAGTRAKCTSTWRTCTCISSSATSTTIPTMRSSRARARTRARRTCSASPPGTASRSPADFRDSRPAPGGRPFCAIRGSRGRRRGVLPPPSLPGFPFAAVSRRPGEKLKLFGGPAVNTVAGRFATAYDAHLPR